MSDDLEEQEQLELRYVAIDQLPTWERNAKQHDLGGIVQSMMRHGMRDPLTFDAALNDGAGGIVAGNGRGAALRMMHQQGMSAPRGIRVGDDGTWYAPVLFGLNAQTQAAAEAYGIAHNNLTMAGGNYTDADMSKMWDSVGYAQLLVDLAEQGETPITVDESALDALLTYLADDGSAAAPDYTPNTAPDVGYTPVTEEQLDKKAGELENRFTSGSTYIDVVCPECMHTFYLNKADVS